jgi:aminopeptidase N
MRGTLRDDPASFWDVPGFFLAHEIAHQWWGHGVAARNYHERWISEAMAHYAAALWVRQHHGEERFRDVMQRMSRWALRHAAQGPLDLGHRLGHVKGDPQVYRAVVYDKGAWVLHMLREITGPEAFGRALAALQRDHRFRKTGADHLRAALETASGLDLAPYFREWVHGTAVPELMVSQKTTAGPTFATAVTIRARNVPGPVPLEIAVVHRNGRERSRVMLPPEGGTFTIETPAAPRRVEVNRDGGLLARVVRGRR